MIGYLLAGATAVLLLDVAYLALDVLRDWVIDWRTPPGDEHDPWGDW